jgi:hypothetical protein
VANASSLAADNAVSQTVAAAETVLIERIARALEKSAPSERIAREVTVEGRSGGERHFDFSIRADGANLLLTNGVSPYHTPVSAQYVAFADTDGDRQYKLAVYSRPLETNDTALLQRVASIVPIAAFEARTIAFAHGG